MMGDVGMCAPYVLNETGKMSRVVGGRGKGWEEDKLVGNRWSGMGILP